MFSKTKKTIVPRHKSLHGELVGEGDLDLRGHVQGSIKVDNLVISKRGRVNGEVIAETVRVLGYVKGSIKAREVILERGAEVVGELSYERLSVAGNADLAAKLNPRPLLKLLGQRPPIEDVVQRMVATA